MNARRRDHEVVVPHQCIEFRDRLRDFRAHPSVGLVRQRDLGHDPLSRQVLEKRLSALEPDEMGTQAHHDPRPALRDLAPQLGP